MFYVNLSLALSSGAKASQDEQNVCYSYAVWTNSKIVIGLALRSYLRPFTSESISRIILGVSGPFQTGFRILRICFILKFGNVRLYNVVL